VDPGNFCTAILPGLFARQGGHPAGGAAHYRHLGPNPVGSESVIYDLAAFAETADAAPGITDEADALQDSPATEFVWTPEAVAGCIEKMVMHWAHLIRRARWFCLLSESSLSWEAAGQPPGDKTMIVFERGRLVQRNELIANGKTTTPPRFARSFRERQNSIDLKTYDRLWVVTTEMRRIISKGRNIELRLGPEVILRSRQLIKALQWV
jgi:DNA polymerase-3 subunit epsilon